MGVAPWLGMGFYFEETNYKGHFGTIGNLDIKWVFYDIKELFLILLGLWLYILNFWRCPLKYLGIEMS